MITLYSGLVVRQPLVEDLIPEFEARSGVHVKTTFEPTSVLLQRIAEGDCPDLVLGVTASLQHLPILDQDSTVEIAVSSVGFARPAEMKGPRDDSTAVFLEYLLNARAVAYSLTGASGLHFADRMRERGVMDRINERAIKLESGLTAEAVNDGRADIAIQQISELLSVTGTHIVQPIPDELQAYASFAVGARRNAPAAATEFIGYLTGERARKAFTKIGLRVPST